MSRSEPERSLAARFPVTFSVARGLFRGSRMVNRTNMPGVGRSQVALQKARAP